MSQHEPTSVGPDDAEAFLTQHLGHPVEVEHVGEGMWLRAFAFRHDDRELVVRFGQHREDYEKDRFAGRLASPALPIPDVLDIGSAFDGHFAISTLACGTPLEALDEAGWRTILPAPTMRTSRALSVVASPLTVGYCPPHTRPESEAVRGDAMIRPSALVALTVEERRRNRPLH